MTYAISYFRLIIFSANTRLSPRTIQKKKIYSSLIDPTYCFVCVFFLLESVKMDQVSLFDLLPEEILLHVFSYLDMTELIKMVDVDMHFRRVAKGDLRLKFANMSQLRLGNFSGAEKFSVVRRTTRCHIKLEGFRLVLRFIRVFSSDVRIVSIRNAGAKEINSMLVFTYVNFYLRRIEKLVISYMMFDISPYLLYAFKNVRVLHIVCCNVPRRLCQLSLMFPSVEEIGIFGYNYFEDINKIIVSYKNLKVMGINSMSLSQEYLDILVDLNPHAFVDHISKDAKRYFFN